MRKTFLDAVKFLLELGMIVGPSVGYIFQYVEIQETNDSEGFSSVLVLVVIISNTLRIVWWYGEEYEYALLSQSVLLLCSQFLLLELVTRIRRKQPSKSGEKLVGNERDGGGASQGVSAISSIDLPSVRTTTTRRGKSKTSSGISPQRPDERTDCIRERSLVCNKPLSSSTSLPINEDQTLTDTSSDHRSSSRLASCASIPMASVSFCRCSNSPRCTVHEEQCAPKRPRCGVSPVRTSNCWPHRKQRKKAHQRVEAVVHLKPACLNSSPPCIPCPDDTCVSEADSLSTLNNTSNTLLLPSNCRRTPATPHLPWASSLKDYDSQSTDVSTSRCGGHSATNASHSSSPTVDCAHNHESCFSATTAPLPDSQKEGVEIPMEAPFRHATKCTGSSDSELECSDVVPSVSRPVQTEPRHEAVTSLWRKPMPATPDNDVELQPSESQTRSMSQDDFRRNSCPADAWRKGFRGPEQDAESSLDEGSGASAMAAETQQRPNTKNRRQVINCRGRKLVKDSCSDAGAISTADDDSGGIRLLATRSDSLRKEDRDKAVPARIRFKRTCKMAICHFFNWRLFWSWDYFSCYVIVTTIWSLVWLAVEAAVDSRPFDSVIGYISLMTDAVLLLPQIICILRRRTTYGVSPTLIAFWVGGDLYKAGYFFFKEPRTPIQFKVCAILHLAQEAVLIAFFLILPRRPPGSRRPLPSKASSSSHALPSSDSHQPQMVPEHDSGNHHRHENDDKKTTQLSAARRRDEGGRSCRRFPKTSSESSCASSEELSQLESGTAAQNPTCDENKCGALIQDNNSGSPWRMCHCCTPRTRSRRQQRHYVYSRVNEIDEETRLPTSPAVHQTLRQCYEEDRNSQLEWLSKDGGATTSSADSESSVRAKTSKWSATAGSIWRPFVISPLLNIPTTAPRTLPRFLTPLPTPRTAQ